MQPAEMTARSGPTLQDAAWKARLQELRRGDNYTNWIYLARTYLYFTLVIAAVVLFDQYRQSIDASPLWSVPAFLLGIVLVGAGQHQLVGLGHEGSHYSLFRHRLLNELASDWLCMFPVYSSTHNYRLQHLAHHQFVNDPDRDPDIAQLRASGHWLTFPIAPRQFLAKLLAQLWLPRLALFVLIRARYSAVGYQHAAPGETVRQTWLPTAVSFVYLLILAGGLATGVLLEQSWLLGLVPVGLWLLIAIFFSLAPGNLFPHTRPASPIPPRFTALGRVTFLTAVFTTLAWVQHLTGVWAWLYYLLLWLVPLFTSFSLFMIMRQWVQHGNADRGWLTNTRIFFVDRCIAFAVFPIGQDFHLPHHLYPTVPHYRLPQLHRELLEYPEYRQQAIEVHGYFRTPVGAEGKPCTLDVLAKRRDSVYSSP